MAAMTLEKITVRQVRRSAYENPSGARGSLAYNTRICLNQTRDGKGDTLRMVDLPLPPAPVPSVSICQRAHDAETRVLRTNLTGEA
jgi:hypothetical protein